jgi:hypothetical protein
MGILEKAIIVVFGLPLLLLKALLGGFIGVFG